MNKNNHIRLEELANKFLENAAANRTRSHEFEKNFEDVLIKMSNCVQDTEQWNSLLAESNKLKDCYIEWRNMAEWSQKMHNRVQAKLIKLKNTQNIDNQ